MSDWAPRRDSVPLRVPAPSRRRLSVCSQYASTALSLILRFTPQTVLKLLQILADLAGGAVDLVDAIAGDDASNPQEATLASAGNDNTERVEVPLERLAWARSGDKGDKANIGVMARKREYFPWISAALTAPYVASRFAHFMASPEMDRYVLPGLPALNFVLHHALGGGGVASLRNDPQAKGYAQILLDTPVTLPASLLED